jgi:hypothetical protein
VSEHSPFRCVYTTSWGTSIHDDLVEFAVIEWFFSAFQGQFYCRIMYCFMSAFKYVNYYPTLELVIYCLTDMLLCIWITLRLKVTSAPYLNVIGDCSDQWMSMTAVLLCIRWRKKLAAIRTSIWVKGIACRIQQHASMQSGGWAFLSVK